MKKMARYFFWSLFIAWNIFALFIIMNNRKPQATQPIIAEQLKVKQNGKQNDIQNGKQNDIQTAEQKAKAKKETIIQLENDRAVYKFCEDRLEKVELKEYRENGNFKKIVDNEPIEIIWQGDITPSLDDDWKISKKDNMITMQLVKQGVKFTKTFYVEDNYKIKCTTCVQNNSKHPIVIQAGIKAKKKQFEKHQSLLFSGISTFDGKVIKNIKAHKIKNQIVQTKQKAWCAFNEKYWLIALTSAPEASLNINCLQDDKNSIDKNVNDTHPIELAILNKAHVLEPKTETSSTFELYIGPKQLNLLKNFGENTSMYNITDTINYGWLFFITRPLHVLFIMLSSMLNSVVLALVLLTILMKLVTWPFTTRSHVFMKRMRVLTPEIEQIRERFKDNAQLMNSEIYAFYKRHKINPISFLTPAILQMLMLFPLYKVLSLSIELYNQPFPFWITDLSSKDPTSIFNLFGILPFDVTGMIHIGAWPLLMGVTMIIQQLISSLPETQEQRNVQYIMAIFFTWIMSSLPAGVVIYWTIMNMLTIVQILYIDFRYNRQKS